MRVLLFGSNGMLGQAVKDILSDQSGLELFLAARNNADFNFDFCNDAVVEKCFQEVRPEAVVNVAAIVNLQKCEEFPGEAYKINSRFCSVLAEQSRKYESYLVQVSTDHYYSHQGNVKHDEDAPITLLNEYARTKYAGECFARTYHRSVVLRTNIIGFRGDADRPTFLEWAVDSIKHEKPMTLFEDFYTSSIHTRQFARILSDILKLQPKGVYNLASSSVSSKAEFLEALSKKLFRRKLSAAKGSVRNLKGCARAESLGLDTSKTEKLLGYRLPNLDEVLESVSREYNRRQGLYEV